MGIMLDPLTDQMRNGTWWDYTIFACDCPARDNDAANHWWTCSITPIFATLSLSLELSDALNDFVRLTGAFGTTQTVIKCAECGKERIGRDMNVVYQAIINGPSNYKYPKNLVKAICPEHNRNSTAGRVHAR